MDREAGKFSLLILKESFFYQLILHGGSQGECCPYAWLVYPVLLRRELQLPASWKNCLMAIADFPLISSSYKFPLLCTCFLLVSLPFTTLSWTGSSPMSHLTVAGMGSFSRVARCTW